MLIRRKIFVGLSTLWVLSSACWGQLKHGDRIVTVVKTDAVNVRSSPDLFPDDPLRNLLGRIPRGTQMKQIGKQGPWYRVVLPDGRDAWVYHQYAEEGIARDLLEVRIARARVRRSPSTGSASRVIATVETGDLLSLVRKQGKWFLAVLPDGRRRGWIRQDMVLRRPVDLSRGSLAPEEAAAETPAQTLEVDVKASVDRDQAGPDHLAEGRRQARSKPDTEADKAVGPGRVETPEAPGTERWAAGETYLFLALLFGSLVAVAAVGLARRRRRAARQAGPVYRRRNPDRGFDAVLEYAVEKRPLLRAIEAAERKRAEMDEALRQHLKAIGKEGPKLPEVESTDALIKRVEDLRQTILGQEERAQVYADLVRLQNEKIDALDEEIDALKKLIVTNFKEGQKAKPAGERKGEVSA